MSVSRTGREIKNGINFSCEVLYYNQSGRTDYNTEFEAEFEHLENY